MRACFDLRRHCNAPTPATPIRQTTRQSVQSPADKEVGCHPHASCVVHGKEQDLDLARNLADDWRMVDVRFTVALALALSVSCGSPSGSGSGTDGGGSTTDAGLISISDDASAECVGTTGCDNGFVCTGEQCCAVEDACGSLCCAGAELCSFGVCVEPGDTCLDSTECAANHYCEYAAGEEVSGEVPLTCTSGVIPPNGKCLPKPPECTEGQVAGDPPVCLVSCEYRPPATAFLPELKYSWGSLDTAKSADSIMMAPIVIQLDDDSCDGIVNERDIPEIVFTTFEGGDYNNNGTLHAISIVEGVVVEKWAVNAGATSQIHPGRSIAGGNFDGLPGNEVAVCTTDGRVRAYDAAGADLWLSAAGTCSMPSIADLDQDGTVEIITESQIIDGATGLTKATYASTGNVVVMDVTGDGKLDIVSASRVLDATGAELANSGLPGTYVAVGDLDNDGVPEIVVADTDGHRLHIWRVKNGEPGNAEIVRQNIDINGPLSPTLCAPGKAGRTKGGGPPTIADFNGDGFPDVALAGGVGYAVFDGSKLMTPPTANVDTLLWIKQTTDCSSAATGSSVFDFNGDGSAEVVYADETTLRVYEGTTGTELYSTCNTTGTLYEYPLIADVDNDGQADILVISNNYSPITCEDDEKTTGLRIFGDANGAWVRTRSVWNQHAYHVTNVEESGEIPTIEAANYLQPKLNNFRQNVQPTGEFSAPDLIVSVIGLCSPSDGLLARVQNIGEAAAPAGIPVAFYAGDPDMGGVELPGSPLLTTRPLHPAEGEDLLLVAATESDVEIYVVVDPAPMHTWHECREDNNKSLPAFACAGID